MVNARMTEGKTLKRALRHALRCRPLLLLWRTLLPASWICERCNQIQLQVAWMGNLGTAE